MDLSYIVSSPSVSRIINALENILQSMQQVDSDVKANLASVVRHDIEQELHENNKAIARANIGAESVENSKNIVLVQPTQPTTDANKIWINSNTIEYQVPTYEEFKKAVQVIPQQFSEEEKAIARANIDADELISVQSNQPSKSNNKLWINNEIEEVEVPTTDGGSIVLKTNVMKYKDPNTNQYVQFNAVAQKTTEEQLQELEDKKNEIMNSIPDSYSSLSNQVRDLKNSFLKYESFNIIEKHDMPTGKINGITFSWNGEECIANGTATSSDAILTLAGSKTVMPMRMEKDETYYLNCNSSSPNLNLVLICYNSAQNAIQTFVVEDKQIAIKIPTATVGVIVGLRVSAKDTVTNAKASNFEVMTAPTTKEMAKYVDDSIEKIDSKLKEYGFLNSLLNKESSISTNGNVVFNWNENKTQCVVSCINGTTSTNAAVNIMLPFSPNNLPPYAQPGDEIYVKYITSNPQVRLQFSFNNGATFYYFPNNTTNERGEGKLIIPTNATNWRIGIYVSPITSLEENAIISKIELYSKFSEMKINEVQDELNNQINDVQDEISDQIDNIKKEVIPDVTSTEFPIYNINLQWQLGWYVDQNTGIPTQKAATSTSKVSCTLNKIPIPKNYQVIINFLLTSSSKVFLYDKEGNYIYHQDNNKYFPTNQTYVCTDEDGAYFRIQYPEEPSDSEEETAIEKLNRYVNIMFVNKNTQLVYNNNQIEYVNNYSNGYKALTTINNAMTPIVLTDTSETSFENLSFNNIKPADYVNICGKNIVYFNKTSESKNNINYTYNRKTGLMTVSSTEGANPTVAATSYFFSFAFAKNTVVSISSNPSKHQPYDYLNQLRVYTSNDGGKERIWFIGNEGTTIECKANVTYHFYAFTRKGFKDTITYKPQIEIATSPTTFEPYNGFYGTLPFKTEQGVQVLDVGEDNIFNFSDNESYHLKTEKIYTYFDQRNQTINIRVIEPRTSNTILYTTSGNSATINNVNFNYLYKIPSNTTEKIIHFSGIPKRLQGKIYAQIFDGTNYYTIYDEKGYTLIPESSKEYGYRVIIFAKASFTDIYKPVISTGLKALINSGSKLDTTTIYVVNSGGNNPTVTVSAVKMTNTEKIKRNNEVTEGLIKLTANKICTPFARLATRKPIITLIDDDTTSLDYVSWYHDICESKGIVGNYAVETKNVTTGGQSLLQYLLNCEEEGYGCLYHCYEQSGDRTRYWQSNYQPDKWFDTTVTLPDESTYTAAHFHDEHWDEGWLPWPPWYNETQIKKNFMRGLREMKELGFSAYNYWITPYGVNDDFIRSLARTHGMQCIFNCPSRLFSQTGYVHINGNADRWDLPRLSIEKVTDPTAEESYISRLKQVIDGCVLDKGWLIFVTHANTWGVRNNSNGADVILETIIDYALDKGVEFLSVPEAFEIYKPVFLLNELL